MEATSEAKTARRSVSYQSGVIMGYTMIDIVTIRMIDNNTFGWVSREIGDIVCLHD